MTFEEIENVVSEVLSDYCTSHEITLVPDKNTALLGSQSICDSLGLVNLIVDIETGFLDRGVELSLLSEAAMSSRISPFRSVGALCNFIANQLGVEQHG